MDTKTINLDIKRMLEGVAFEDLVRYRHDPFWVAENTLQDEIESRPYRRLESDADHSWHLADMVLLIGPHFPELDLGKATQFAVLHDKLEIFTGDDLAVGLSGSGKDSHAFNDELRQKKLDREHHALSQYLASLPGDVATFQKPLFDQYHAKSSPEALFVNALDKMQVLVRILYAKDKESGPFGGAMHDIWWEFIENYQRPKIAQFTALVPYGEELLRRIKAKR